MHCARASDERKKDKPKHQQANKKTNPFTHPSSPQVPNPEHLTLSSLSRRGRRVRVREESTEEEKEEEEEAEAVPEVEAEVEVEEEEEEKKEEDLKQEENVLKEEEDQVSQMKFAQH